MRVHQRSSEDLTWIIEDWTVAGARSITDVNHIVIGLPNAIKRVNGSRGTIWDVQTDCPRDCSSCGKYRIGIQAGTFNQKTLSSQLIQKRFFHLATSAVVPTNEQYRIRYFNLPIIGSPLIPLDCGIATDCERVIRSTRNGESMKPNASSKKKDKPLGAEACPQHE